MSNDAAQKVTSHILPALPYAENALEPVITLEDTVEYFNLIQQLRLKPDEKQALVAFMRCL